MIEIRHKQTGAVLHQIEVGTLKEARLSDLSLCGADLTGADLAGANLSGAVCRATDFSGANLAGANLAGAYLHEAVFRETNLANALMLVTSLDTADLSGADLTGANLTGSYLAAAKLNRAKLTYTNLQSTYLGGADLTGARMGFTVLADCPSLHQATGLAQLHHLGPSSLDLPTLRAGAAALPAAFLRAVGLSQEEIDRLRALYAEAAPYRSCLLAYAPADRDVADRLRAGLLAHNVSCWPHCADLESGYVLQVAFHKAMKQHDRLVWVGSRHALQQPDLLDLLAAALQRERDTAEQKLFLVTVDRSLPGDALLRMVDEKRTAGEATPARVLGWRGRPVPDFHDWSDESSYHSALEQLLNALTNPAVLPATSPHVG